jgi:hypothetical protein
MDRIPYGETRFYQDELIQCQGYHDDYACSCDGVAMSSNDGTDPSTRVPAVRCVWVPVTVSYHARHLMPLLSEDLAPTALLDIEKPPSVAAGDPGTYRAGSHGGSTVGRQVVKYCLSATIVIQIYFKV